MRVVTSYPCVAGPEPVLTSARIGTLAGRVATTYRTLPMIHLDGPTTAKK